MTETAQAIIPESHRDLLAAPILAHVATTGPTGEPQSNPVWFAWDGEHLRIALAPDRQKYRNLRRDPRIALSLVDPANPGRQLEIRGRVIGVAPDPDQQALRRKLRQDTGADSIPGIEGERVMLVVEPVHTSHMG